MKPAMRLLGGIVLSVALSLHHSPAHGQTAAGNGESPPPTGSPAASSEAERSDAATIVVTGTRITSRGFTAPTPTTMVNSDDLAKTAQPNIFTSVAQLPSLQGSTGVATGTFSTSSGQQGLSSFSLRGLGTIRTLTLLDGQRVVGANVTGVPDISQFPQLLIQRVDIVTGGASASYGSDAVGGVVNFVTDKRFEGFKAQAQGGITTYGDDGQFLLGAAAGHSLFDDRLHLEGSVEYDHENGVPAGGFGENAPNGRDWFHATTLLNTGITNNGLPQYVYSNHAQSYQYAKYGLITAGPLQGTAFDAAGNPHPFLYGSNGVPVKNATGSVTGCYVGFCVGGDNSGAVGIGASLQSAIERLVGFGRIGFSLDEDNEIYATVNVAQVKSSNQPNPGSAKSGLTISCANPFVPASIQAACADNGITSFQYGLDNAFLANPLVRPKRMQERVVLGAEGKVNLISTDWHYDAYYEHGQNTTDIHVFNMPLNPRYSQAIQAISLGGQIVCASAVARANGCVPINVFGNVTPNAAALAYSVPAAGPFQHTHQTEDAASVAINGDPFSSWAGPVSIAFGAEYRRELYRVIADPYGNGVSSESPNSDNYPADPIVSSSGSNWYAGNYHDGTGQYHVTEAFLETNLPFLDSESFGKANLNTAGRWTDYSTSGVVYTWKVGGTWQTPYSPLRLRAVLSRDVRAPNLSELFAAPVSTTTPGLTNPFTTPNTTLTVIQNAIGNTALKPETARNTEFGLVLVNPQMLPGFSASVDYYRIKVSDIISTLTAQQEVNFCFAGLQQYCGAFNLAPATGTPFVNVQSFNLASIETKGIDLEASYQFGLAKLHVPGSLTIRALATHVIDFTSNSGIRDALTGQPIPALQLAGQNSGGSGTFGNTPHWKVYGTQSWDFRNIGIDLTERWLSSGVFGYQYVVCQSNCPVSTVNNPTLNYDHMAGALYFDLGGRYSLTDKLTAFVKVDNLFDRDPVAAPQTNTGLDINPALYDTLGRTYRAGFRFNF
jgi:outer membrane receptor protein involved in Fe transport